jgi:hypothetical protein
MFVDDFLYCVQIHYDQHYHHPFSESYQISKRIPDSTRIYELEQATRSNSERWRMRRRRSRKYPNIDSPKILFSFASRMPKWNFFGVQWLTLLLRVRELPRSNLGPETDCADWGLSWFASAPPNECRTSSLKLSHYRFLPNHSHFIVPHSSDAM